MKRENKTIVKFLATVLVAGIIGGIAGFLSGHFETSLAWLLMKMRGLLLSTAPYALVILNLIFLGTAAAYYFKSSGMNKAEGCQTEENEEVYNRIDKTAGLAISLTSVGLILNLLWFCFTSLAYFGHYITSTGLGVAIIAFALFSGVSIFLQRVIINFVKKLNPEKQGEALDRNFQKDWFGSFDEQERIAAYKAAFQVYRTSPALYIGIFLVLIFTSFVVDIGVAPFLVWGVLWLTQTIVYLKETMKHS